MKLKIYKHKSLKTKIDDDIVKMQDYFKSDFFRQFIDDTLVVDIEETNKDYMDDTLYKSIEDTHDTAMLIYEQGTFPIYGSAQMYSHKLVKIYVSVNPIEDNIDYSWKVMAHELVHAYWLMTIVKEGKWLPNILDYSSPTPYYKNDQPFAPDGNFAQQLKALQPYFKKTPVVTLKRMDDDGVQTLGQLFYKDFECKTLERPWKNNAYNISCIPKGEYICKYTFSPKFLKYTYLLQGTGKRSGIRIHSGNYFFDIEGCILLGDSYRDINKDKKVDVLNSRITINKFEKLLNQKDFKLRII
jgi:hypothetical protein